MEERRPYCWSYGAVGHMARACPGKKAAPWPGQVVAAAVVSGEVPDGNENMWRKER